MVARRLLIVLLVLLVASTVAGTLLPTPTDEETGGDETRGEPTVTEPTETRPTASERQIEFKIAPGTIRVFEASVGEQLAVTIRSDESGLLEIPALGLVDAVAPGAPARFNLLPSEPGSFGVRFLEDERVVARIEVGD